MILYIVNVKRLSRNWVIKGSQTRANYYTALALESRAMLYAGSIAKIQCAENS